MVALAKPILVRSCFWTGRSFISRIQPRTSVFCTSRRGTTPASRQHWRKLDSPRAYATTVSGASPRSTCSRSQSAASADAPISGQLKVTLRSLMVTASGGTGHLRVQEFGTPTIVVGAVKKKAVSGRPSRHWRVHVQQAPALGERICHPVAEDKPPARRGPSICREPVGGVNAADDEGDVRSHRLVEEGDVLQVLAEMTLARVYFLAPAEERDRLKAGLAVHPLGPQPSVGFEEVEADVGDRGQARFDHLHVQAVRLANLH